MSADGHHIGRPTLDWVPLEDGGRLALKAWRRPGAPRIVFSHGAGLAVGAYADFLELLAARYEVFAVDLRGHGGSVGAALPAAGILDRLTADMEAVWRYIAAVRPPAPVVGVFHSISGVLALRQTVRHGPRWAALALLDPPLTPPDGHALTELKLRATEIMVARVAGRRSRFPSVEAFADDLAGRSAFAQLPPHGTRLLAEATLVRDPAARDYRLCVAPELEARLYRENVLPELAGQLDDIATPVRFICSDPTVPNGSPIPTLCRAIADEAGLGFEVVAGTTHLLPMEEPGACLAAVDRFLAGCGLAPKAG